MKYTTEQYKDEVRRQLQEHNYPEDKINEIVGKLRVVNDPYTLNVKQHREILSKSGFNLNDVRVYRFSYWFTALCIKNFDKHYSVTFSFINPSDDVIVNDKYVYANRYLGKYTYDVEASTPISAVCRAFNTNIRKFPHSVDRTHKAVPRLTFNCGPLYFTNTDKVCDCSDFDKLSIPTVFVNTHEKYKRTRQILVDRLGIEHKDIRFYLEFRRLGAMVIRNNGKYKVTFSFISEKDADFYTIKGLRKNAGLSVQASKLALLENFIAEKYTYEITDVTDSMSAVVRAFNLYKKEFPSTWPKLKMRTEVCTVSKMTNVNEFINEIKI